ncbi:hypothetical protein B0H14DRAFT_1184659 [Mycena olivaceomarginata]|nr:hypothetical protein B0H14DRAFT_1184659 [Mycena olivaceomarginata]
MPGLAYGDVNHNGHDSHLRTLSPSRGNGPEQLAIALLHEPLDFCVPVSGYAAVEPCQRAQDSNISGTAIKPLAGEVVARSQVGGKAEERVKRLKERIENQGVARTESFKHRVSVILRTDNNSPRGQCSEYGERVVRGSTQRYKERESTWKSG